MQLPKKFIYFLAGSQTILTLSHWALYVSLIFFFPAIHPYKHILLPLLGLLSVSFLLSSILDFKYDGPVLRACYIISGVWIVTWFYLLLASLVSSLAFIVNGQSYPGLTGIFFIIALALVAYGIINARILRTVELKIKLDNLPQGWQGKTAVMVSDLHLGHVLREGFAKKIIAKINELSPEIIFIPGDFYDGVKTDFAALANLFKQAKSAQGIYFCSGNHEMFAGYEQCESALRGTGIKILENEKVEINGLQIAGIAYHHDTIPGLEKILGGLELDRGKPSILLKHVPLQIKEAAEAGFSLQLSGHSHRGQIWPGQLFTTRYFKGFDYGFKRFKNLQVYTSSGAGTWGPPMRIFTKSEIVKITFE